jgi:hypothetical protein
LSPHFNPDIKAESEEVISVEDRYVLQALEFKFTGEKQFFCFGLFKDTGVHINVQLLLKRKQKRKRSTAAHSD